MYMMLWRRCKMEKPVLEIDISGPDGNIYVIMGMVMQILRKQRRYTDWNNLRDAITSSKSYANALREINKVVELIDISADGVLEKYLKEGVNNG